MVPLLRKRWQPLHSIVDIGSMMMEDIYFRKMDKYLKDLRMI
jgi:hypothetical protein